MLLTIHSILNSCISKRIRLILSVYPLSHQRGSNFWTMKLHLRKYIDTMDAGHLVRACHIPTGVKIIKIYTVYFSLCLIGS